jgi:hypothetical protein
MVTGFQGITQITQMNGREVRDQRSEIGDQVPEGGGKRQKSYQVMDKRATILFLTHAMERMVKWELSPDIVGETLLNPEEVLTGHHNRFIAHRCYGEHILRAIYEYEDMVPSLVTVYFPCRGRYYQGGGDFEDKILG